MNRVLPIVAIAVSLLLIGQSTGIAQTSIRLGLTTGVNFANQAFSQAPYQGAYPQAYRTGFILGGLADIHLSGIWSLQAEPRYAQEGTKFQNVIITSGNDPRPFGTTDATYDLDYFEIPILLKATFEGTDARPFVMGGLSFQFSNFGEISAPGTRVVNRNPSDRIDIQGDMNSVNVALDLGAGLEFRLSPKVSLLLDARYAHGLGDVYSNSAVPSAKSYSISLLGGLLFDLFPVSEEAPVTTAAPEPAKVPSTVDTDGDGLTDADEINIYKTNPYQADSDGDGLTDGEEVLKYKTNPLKADTDEDGLSDGDEVKKYKTNPLDPDTDRGSVKDGVEVFRGTNPLDPSDDVPRKEELKIDVGKAIILEGIVFKTGSAEITAASAATLEKAYNTLQQNPDILVEIDGHTDNVGKHAYNQKLSLARANSVKDYLVQRGIQESRIATKGYGYDKPIAGNDTPEGRQKNRRIEFLRTK